MNEEDAVVDGAPVRFVRSGEGSWSVFSLRAGSDEAVPIGSLELAEDGAGFVARRREGGVLTRPSPWGGPVTARFGSRDLAARALLDPGGSSV